MGKIAQDGVRMFFGVADHVGHAGFFPARVDIRVARCTARRADEGSSGCRSLGKGGRKFKSSACEQQKGLGDQPHPEHCNLTVRIEARSKAAPFANHAKDAPPSVFIRVRANSGVRCSSANETRE